jgi:hypothetical protein
MRWMDVNEEVNDLVPTNFSGPGCYMTIRDGIMTGRTRSVLSSVLGYCKSRIDDIAIVILNIADISGARTLP